MPTYEFTLQKQQARGVRARALLENELLKEAFETLEQSYISAWRLTPPTADDAREKLYLAVNVVGKVKDHLARVLSDGVMAARELADMAREVERKKKHGIVG